METTNKNTTDVGLRFRNRIFSAPERRNDDGEIITNLPSTNTDGTTISYPQNFSPQQDHSKNSEINFSSTGRLPQNLGFFDFFIGEITRGYALDNDEARYTEKRKKVYAFIKIPRELEKFLFYGFLQCTDAFLFIFTLLPVRFVLGLFHLAFAPKNVHFSTRKTPLPSEICDLLKVLILFFATVSMTFIDTSWMYHVVRGQAVIKLYIFYNMLEVADRLFSSFGQDILDALFWTATEPHSSTSRTKSTASNRRSHLDHLGTLPHLCLAILYVIGHAILVLFQATTLNVAFNSHNKALLTIMLSNNFVELKGSVFKKFAKNNLFQMACSDVRERFHNLILLAVVVVRNLTAVNWRAEHFWEMLPDLALVLFGEFLVDWVKHAFITKFNEIPYDVYKDFTITIAYDVAKSRQKTAFSDHSDQVSRRMGFIPLPLSVVVIRILGQSLSRSPYSTFSLAVLLSVTYATLVSMKIVNSIVVLGKACQYIETYEEMQKQAELLKRLRKTKAKSVPASPRLSLIEFSDINQQNCPAVPGFTVSDVLREAAEELARFTPDNTGLNSPASYAPTPQHLSADAQQTAALKLLRRSKSVTHMEPKSSRHSSGKKDAATDVPQSAPKDAPDVIILEENEATKLVNVVKVLPATGECESLKAVDRYTLCNDDRIES